MHANMHIFKPATTHWHLWNCHFHWGHSTHQPLPPESSWHFHNKRQKAWKESERAFDCQLKTQSWRVDKQFMSLLCEFFFFYYAALKKFLKISINVCYSQWLARQANKMLIKLTDFCSCSLNWYLCLHLCVCILVVFTSTRVDDRNCKTVILH